MTTSGSATHQGSYCINIACPPEHRTMLTSLGCQSNQSGPIVTDAYIFLFSEVEVFIIRYDKMVSHMMPTCAFVFVIKARDPGKDLPYHLLDMCML
jgi:hypothetical protein